MPVTTTVALSKMRTVINQYIKYGGKDVNKSLAEINVAVSGINYYAACANTKSATELRKLLEGSLGDSLLVIDDIGKVWLLEATTDVITDDDFLNQTAMAMSFSTTQPAVATPINEMVKVLKENPENIVYFYFHKAFITLGL